MVKLFAQAMASEKNSQSVSTYDGKLSPIMPTENDTGHHFRDLKFLESSQFHVVVLRGQVHGHAISSSRTTFWANL
jgi:hypothetical protein